MPPSRTVRHCGACLIVPGMHGILARRVGVRSGRGRPPGRRRACRAGAGATAAGPGRGRMGCRRPPARSWRLSHRTDPSRERVCEPNHVLFQLSNFLLFGTYKRSVSIFVAMQIANTNTTPAFPETSKDTVSPTDFPNNEIESCVKSTSNQPFQTLVSPPSFTLYGWRRCRQTSI